MIKAVPLEPFQGLYMMGFYIFYVVKITR